MRKEPDIVYELGTEMIRRSIIAGVENAESLGGFMALKDLKAKNNT